MRRDTFKYWVKFDKDPSPVPVISEHFVEFRETLERLVIERAQMPEWIIRDYTR